MFLTAFLFLYQSPSSSSCTVFDSILSNIDEVLSINLSANVFVFGDFDIHHKDWLTYSGGTDRPDEFCYSFSLSNDLTQMVNFPTQIPDCDSYSPAFMVIKDVDDDMKNDVINKWEKDIQSYSLSKEN